MKKLSLLLSLAIVLFAGCKKENPISSTTHKVSIPQVFSFIEDEYFGAIGGEFDSQIERLEGGFVGYAVDTIYGFNVDTIWLTDLTWNGDTLEAGVTKVEIYATNADGVSNSVSSDFVVLEPLSNPYLTDISGFYSRTSPSPIASNVRLEKIIDGIYKVYNPALSANLCWVNSGNFSLLYLKADLTADLEDFDFGSTFSCGNFGGFTVENEVFDPSDNSFCFEITQLAFPGSFTRCMVKN